MFTMRRMIALNSRADTQADVDERVRHREACAQAYRETMEKYAPLTLANFAEAAAFQERRISELTQGARP